MHMAGEQHVAAPRQRVWEALNDPEVLAAAIPGCQTLEKQGDDRFIATVEIKIGPIGARFKGAVRLEGIDPGNGYTLVGEGNAGIAGSAQGSAKVRLADDGDGTRVTYEVDSQVAGRLAQLGGPIIDATAKQLAGKFFTKFGEVVGGVPAQAAALAAQTAMAGTPVAGVAAAPAAVAERVAASATTTLWGWVAALVMAMLTGFALGRISAFAWVFLLIALMMVVTAAAAFEAGRRSCTGARR